MLGLAARTRQRMERVGPYLRITGSISRSRSSRELRRTRWLPADLRNLQMRPLRHRKTRWERTWRNSPHRRSPRSNAPKLLARVATSWRTSNLPWRGSLRTSTRPRPRRTLQTRLRIRKRISRPRVRTLPSITRSSPSTITRKRPGGRRRTRNRWYSCKSCRELPSRTKVGLGVHFLLSVSYLVADQSDVCYLQVSFTKLARNLDRVKNRSSTCSSRATTSSGSSWLWTS